ncbi:glutathione S-transferase [Mucidula mucida]|nr:glutathione S-transferase [Mucidula mucida]
MLKLFVSQSSPNAKRVAMVLLEHKVPFEAIPVDMRNKAHKTPAYLAQHPFGEVPYIDDDGLVVYESRAICRYICRKYQPGPQLLPAEGDLRAYAMFEQAVSVEVYNFDVHVQAAARERFLKPMLGMEWSEAVYKEALERLERCLDVYDGILARQKYIAGDVLTLVDLFHIPYAFELERLAKLDMFQTRPNVARYWWNDRLARESWNGVAKEIHSTLSRIN